ncbi:MAG: Hpt domain-containing protein, partial [Desulfobulbaceae bacterium]|nr:Hpt domain-containing protein [Desulfobulbaceae bacterium]
MIDLSMLQDFMAETGEHLEEMETNLLKLEKDPGNREILNDIFRSAHTIKGSSEYLGMVKIAELSHKLETLLDMVRQGERRLNREIIDVLIGARDRIVNLVEDLDRNQAEETEIQDLVDRIEQLSAGRDDPGEGQEETVATEIKPENFRDETPDHPETGDNPDREVLTGAGDDETYEEEYDEELFGIFITQLKKNLSLLRTRIKASPDPDNVGQVLEMSIESINSLRSSANYMGYERLVLLYERWGHEIKKDQEALSSGEDVSLESMNTYIDKIERLFPQVKELAVEGSECRNDGSRPVERLGDEKEKSEGTAADEDAPDALDSEEEQDEELFAIFIQQLKEGISLLRSRINELRHSDNGMEVLDRCLECIDRLKASSNYMDYTKLCRVYENWCAEIKEVKNRLSSGEEPFFEFMDAYIKKILGFFPNTGSLRVEGDEGSG